MKQFSSSTLIILFIVCFSRLSFSQVAIGTGATAPSPDTNAVLLLEGNGSQGIIIPKVSSLGTFGKPGMIVYNTATGTVHYFNTTWVQVGSGGAGSQGIQIVGNKVLIGTGAGFSTEFSIANTAPTIQGQILMWDTSLNSGAGGWTSSANTAPSTIGQVLKWNGSRWEPGTDNTGAVATLSGDVSGATTSTTISTTAGNSIATALNNGATTSRILESRITPSGTNNQVLTTVGGVTQWANPTGGALPSLSANQLLSNNGANTAINVAGDVGLSVSGTTGTFTIANNAITDAKVATGISGSKINPAFGAQNITTTTGSASIGGGLNVGLANGFTINNAGNITKINGANTSFPATNAAGVLTNDGTGTLTWAVAGGTGTVTSVTAGTGLTGGAITTSGTLSVDVGTTANKIVQLDATGKLPAVDGSQLTGLAGGGDITGVTAGTGLTGGAASGNATLNVDVGTTANKIVQLDATGKLPVIDGSQLTNLPAGAESDPTVKAINGLVKSNGTTVSAATAGTDYLTPTGSAAGLTGITAAQIPNLDAAKITTGTLSTARLDVGTTANKIVQLDATGKLPVIDGSQLTNLPAGAETDPTVKAINGLVKSNGTTISAATAGTDYLTPIGNGSGLTNLNATNISTGTLPTARLDVGTGANQLVQLDATGKLPAVDGSQLTGLAGGGDITGVTAGTGLTGGAASGNATLNVDVGTTANKIVQLDATGKLPAIDGSQLTGLAGGGDITGVTAGTGLTGGAASGNATLNVDVGTTANKIVQLDATGKLPVIDGSQLTNLPAGAETDPTVKAINGLVKSNGTTVSAATAGTDYLTPTGSAAGLTGITAAQIPNLDAAKIASGTLAIAQGGTNSTATPTSGGISYGTGTAYGFTAAGTGGQLLQSNGAAAPSWVSIPAFLSPTLTSGQLFVGNGSNVATGVAMSGDAGISNAGLLTIQPNSINSSKILDGEIVNADVNATAAIAGTKINPNFGTQNILTTGTLTTGAAGAFAIDATGNIIKIRNVTTSFPAANAAGVLTNDGTGTLTWAAGTGWGLTGNTLAGTERIGSDNAQPLVLETNNTERMRINPTGIVGIGTTSFGGNSMLYVNGGVQVDAGDNNTGTSTHGLTFGSNNSGEVIASQKQVGGPNQNGLDFYTGFVNRMAINAAGNVGIGTATPLSKLDVVGDMRLAQGTAPGVTTDKLYNVGGSLFWNGTNISSGGSGWGLTGNAGINPATNFIGTTDAQPLRFATGVGGTERMRLDATGNFGFGITAPLSKFHIKQSVQVNDFLTDGGSGFFGAGLMFENSGTTDSYYVGYGNGGYFRIGNKSAANVFTGMVYASPTGVGIFSPVPTERLDVTGNLKFSGALMPNNLPGTAGQVLTSAGAGLPPTWAAGSGWGLTGNAGTVDGANFIGTTDNIPLNFRMNNLKAGRIDNVNASTFFGSLAGNLNTGNQNAAFGSQAMEKNVGGATNAAFGQLALNNNTTGGFNVAVGAISMSNNTTGGNNIAVGVQANNNNTTGSGNTSVGYNANYSNVGSTFNTAVGIDALFNNTGANNTAVGRQALFNNTSGSGNTGLGYQAGPSTGTLTNATAVGNLAQVTVSNSLVLGSINGVNGATADTKVGIGTTAPSEALHVTGNVRLSGALMPNNLPGTAGQVLTSAGPGLPPTWSAGGSGWGLNGNAGTLDGTNFIGTTDAIPLNLRVNNQVAGRIESAGANANTLYGYQSGNVNTGIQNAGFGYQALLVNSSGQRNAAFGYQAMSANTTGNGNTAMGQSALSANSTGGANAAFGTRALANNTASNNTAVGNNALSANVSGTDNAAVGLLSLSASTASQNAALGAYSLQSNTTGTGNAGLGYNVLISNTTGAQNTAVGSLAGYTSTAANANTTGSANTFIGYASGPSTPTQLTNATAIGANAVVGTSNTIQLGDVNVTTVNVGSGTTAKLVAGQLQVTGGTLGAGRVLTSDASGNATWQAAGGSGWGLTGNAGTVDGTNFIGTTDNIPFNIRVNNQKAGRIEGATPFGTFYGYQAGQSNGAAQANVAIGYQALTGVTSSSNTAIGYQTLQNTNGGQNTAVGSSALTAASSGAGNTALGQAALANATTANFNTAVGLLAMQFTTGGNNAALGSNAGQFNSSGQTNVFVGFQAGFPNATVANSNTSGSNNTFIGPNTGLGSSTQRTNATAIGANAAVNADNSLVLGSINGVNGATATVNVGIGTSAPTNRLHINEPSAAGNFLRITNNPSPNGLTLGLSGAGSQEAFIANNENAAMYFQTNAANRMAIDATGNIGINKIAPSEKLDVTGNIRFSGALMPNNLPGTSGQVLTSAGAGLPPTWSSAGGGFSTNNVIPRGNGTGLVSSTIQDDGTTAGIGSAPVATNRLTVTNSTSGILQAINATNSQVGAGSSIGVRADASGSTNNNFGVNATASGSGTFGSTGVLGSATGTTTNYGIQGNASGGTTNWAGFFGAGNVHITNALSVGATPGTFGTSGQVLTSAGAGSPPTWNTPSGSTLINNTGTNNLFAGNAFSTSGTDNAIFGANAGTTNSGNYNVFVGAQAANTKTSGDLNTIIGWYAGKAASAAGNTLVGAQAGENTTTGASNTFMGEKSGRNTSTGGVNTFIGQQAGLTNTTGFFNTAIGAFSNMGAAGLQNATAVGYQAQVNQSNSLVLGSINGVNGATASTNVGIGTTTPGTNRLYVSVPSADVTNPVAMRIDNNYTGASTKYGIDVNVDGAGSGPKYGISSSVVGLGGDASTNYGYQVAMTPNGTGTVYGLFSSMSSAGTGPRYGIYNQVNASATNTSGTYGAYNAVSNSGSGNSYILYGSNSSTGAGVDYGLFLTGEDQNYFSGEVGIGISSPTKKLHVIKSPITLYDGAIVGSSSATDNSGFFGAMAYDGGTTNFGVYAHSDALANTSPLGVNRAADGALVNFMSAGSVEGQISVSGTTVSYGAFTGVHYAQMENEKVERGMLVSLNGKNGNLHNKKTSEQVYGITKTAVPNDSKVMGAYLGLMDPLAEKSADNPVQIMAVGNGDMWVVDNGKDLEVGDYLISSDLPGYAMLDRGDYDISHIIARVGENINWNEVQQTINGKKVMNVSVFFENFEVNHKAAKLMAEIKELQTKVSAMKETQDSELAALKKQMEEVMRIVGAEARKKD